MIQKTKPITLESVGEKIQRQRQKEEDKIKKSAQLVQRKQANQNVKPNALEAMSDVQDFLNKNRKHHLKETNAEEEFDLEDPSEYEKEAEDYTMDTLDAYSNAVGKHTLAEQSISTIVSDEEKADNEMKAQKAAKARVDLQ